MKKFISLLFIAFTAIILSSCIIVTSDEPQTNYYNLTCHNVSDTRITDWCVVKNNNVTYAKSKDNYCPINANTGTSTMYLPEGEYYLYCAFVSEPDYDNGGYIKSKRIDLHKDYDVYIDQTFVDEYWK